MFQFRIFGFSLSTIKVRVSLLISPVVFNVGSPNTGLGISATKHTVKATRPVRQILACLFINKLLVNGLLPGLANHNDLGPLPAGFRR